MKNLERLKELLEQTEEFPLNFVFKFIGKNSDLFKESLQGFTLSYPGLKKTKERMSSDHAYIAVTFECVAETSSQVVKIYEAILRLHDVAIVL